jgi:glycosyltransferase involved in cell wall biosynthesis/SAM-dependent methyltransferase
LEFTGERYIPRSEWPEMAYEHWHRYLLATQWVAGQVVLDISSGEGYGSHLLSGVAQRVVGVDADPTVIARARSAYQRSNLEFLPGRAESIPIVGEAVFDVVVSFETIEHLDEAQQAAFASEVKRLLKRSGVLIISTPDRLEYNDDPGERNPFHRHEFSQDEFSAFLRQHFSTISLLGQKIYPASYVWPLHSTPGQTSEYQLAKSESGFQPLAEDSKRLRYLIAVCSDMPLQPPPGSILLDISAAATEARHERLVESEAGFNRLRQQHERLSDALYRRLDAVNESLLTAQEALDEGWPLRWIRTRDLKIGRTELARAQGSIAEALHLLDEVEAEGDWQPSSPADSVRESPFAGSEAVGPRSAVSSDPQRVDAKSSESGGLPGAATAAIGFPRPGVPRIAAPGPATGAPLTSRRAAGRSSRRKILYVVHHHPHQRPGGAQQYAFELYEAMRDREDFEPIFLARDVDDDADLHPGTPIRLADPNDANQYLFADPAGFDWLFMTSPDKSVYTKHFRQFLLDLRPDIVHFLHTAGLGVDLVREVRNTLPDSPILYTLTEFLPICHRHGQMVRTMDDSLCTQASPARCHECFPDISAQVFFMRQRFIQSHFAQVDLFLAASQFLLERYVEWGIPRDKIRHLDYGRPAVDTIAEPATDRVRNRLGFFGQVNQYKGVLVLLDAMRILTEKPRRKFALFPVGTDDGSASRSDVQLWLHGAYQELQHEDFRRAFAKLLAATKGYVTVGGQFDPSDLPRLMANVDWVVVPSIWWENSPLVLHAAFQHRRPVICSDIGSLAEKVSHEINGLHFRVGDSASLAETIRYAVDTPDLWQTLQRGIPEVQRMDDHVAELSSMYRELLAEKVPAG